MLDYRNSERTMRPRRPQPTQGTMQGVGSFQSPALGAATTGANQPGAPLPPADAAPPIGDAGGPPPREGGTVGTAPALGDAGGPPPTFAPGSSSRGDGSPFLPGAASTSAAPAAPAGPPPNPATGQGSPYATMTNYGVGNDLRGTQIAPGESSTLQGQNAAVDHAAGAYQGYQMPGFQGVAGGSYTPGADTTGARSTLQSALASLASTPDRDALARASLANLQPQVQEQFDRMIRQGGQAAAKFGTIGAGFTTSALGDVTRQIAGDFGRNATDMALNAAGQTMGDRLSRVNAASGVTSTLGGEDRSNAGVNQSLRNELRGERDAGNTYAQQGFNNARTQYGDALDAQSGQRAYEANQRSELRGERANQNAMENQAYTRSVQGSTLSDALTGSNFDRAMQLLNAGYGSGGDLASLLQSQSGQSAGQAQQGMGDVSSIIAQYIANRRPQPAATTGQGR